MRKPKLKLGEILVKGGYINNEELEQATVAQKAQGGRLGEVLVRLGLVSEKDIVSALAKQVGVPHVSLTRSIIAPAISQNLREIVPEDFARSHLVMPLSKTLRSLTCAFVDPMDLIAFDNLRQLTKMEINVVAATKTDVERAINDLYGSHDFLQEAVDSSYGEEGGGIETIDFESENLSLDRLIASAEEAPVVKLVNLILLQATKDRASDIHIEPFEKRVAVRFRIDGILYEVPPPSPQLLPALVSRIKILSKLDIAEKRLPQDGGFSIKAENRVIDLRVSTIPSIYGEKIVMRILDKSQGPQTLQELGFESEHLDLYEEAIKRPYGLIFITGPTGSGKTTTLYAALRKIKDPKKNILTIEDPVEYRLEGINQVQVKPHIGLTFAAGLRSFLRQDPDVIMVGEVRDLETAEICVRAALTGHLVLSTMHTNDAPSTVTRLIDIGVGPFLAASSLALIVSQRLIRRLCENCKEEYIPPPELAEQLGLGSGKIFRPKGCPECRKSGYQGRVALCEVLVVDDKIRTLINAQPNSDVLRHEARKNGMKSMWDSGLLKVKRGLTSLEEVASATVGDTK